MNDFDFFFYLAVYHVQYYLEMTTLKLRLSGKICHPRTQLTMVDFLEERIGSKGVKTEDPDGGNPGDLDSRGEWIWKAVEGRTIFGKK